MGKLQRGGTGQIHRSEDFTGYGTLLVKRSAELQRPMSHYYSQMLLVKIRSAYFDFTTSGS